MAVTITDENLAYYLSQLCNSLENAEGARGCIVVTDLDTMKQVLVIPGVKYSQDPITNPTAVAQQYVQIPYSLLAEAIESATAAASSIQTALDNVDAATQEANDAAEAARQAVEDMPDEASEEDIRNIVKNWTPSND
jgi:hypothetical protein